MRKAGQKKTSRTESICFILKIFRWRLAKKNQDVEKITSHVRGLK